MLGISEDFCTDGAHNYEYLNVSENKVMWKMTSLSTGGRVGISLQYEHFDVSASQETVQSFLYTGSTQTVYLWCELFKCLRKLDKWENDFVHWGQVWGFSPV